MNTVRPGEANKVRHVGAMTAVMRAARFVAAPRALRVGVVEGNRIVSERVLDAGEITVGEDESSSIVIAGAGPRRVLFRCAGGRAELVLSEGLRGRVVLASGVVDLADLLARARSSNLAPTVPLDDASRGRVEIAGRKILFQRVEKRPSAGAPQLPLAVKAGERVDWTLTILCAVSFLAHFGVVGAMYSDWADPVVGDSYTIGQLVDLSPKLAKVDPEPAPTNPAIQTPTPTAKPDPTQKPVADARPNGSPNAGPSGPTSRSMSNDNAASLAREANGMLMNILVANNSDARAVDGALRRSEIPPIALAQPDGPAIPDGRDIVLRTGDGPIRPGAKGSLADIGNTRRDPGSNTQPSGPPRDVTPAFTFDARPSTPNTSVRNLDAVVAQMRPGFRRCYNAGLLVDPGMQGDVTIRIKIGPNGEVQSATPVSGSGLSPSVTQCIAQRAQVAQFETDQPATVDVPIKFRLQK